MRASIVGIMVVSMSIAVGAQQSAEEVIRRLGEIVRTDPGQWRFQHPAQPGGEQPAVDDSAWPLVRPEHSWQGDNTAAWYRLRLVVPDQVGGVSVAGSRLVLDCAVDDDMEIYVNGEFRGAFRWDRGHVVLSDSVRPGEEFWVAVRAINQGGPGRLLSASLTYDRLGQVRQAADQHRLRLQFCRRLLETRRAAAERPRYAAALEEAAGRVDFGAVNRGDRAAFESSLADSARALQPFSELSRQYTLYLVGHAHIDMNWLWLWPETKEVCRLTWNQALQFMDEFPDFKFTQSQPGAYIAIEEENPELFARIQKAVARGQWEPAGASWVEGDTNMASGEALARHCLLTSQYYADRFGIRSQLAWLPDNFGHAWTVPSIFADAGVRHFYFCRCSKGYPLFWWEGPDGQRLLGYSYGGYGESLTAGHAQWPLDIDDRLGVPAAMVVYGVGDHGGGPTRRDIETALMLKQDPLFPQVRFATTGEFYREAERAAGDKLPVVKDELNFVFEGCYTTHADVKRWNRESENLLPAAEALAVVAGQWGQPYPAADLTRAWRNTCFNQFHDIFDGSAIHDAYDYSRQLYEQSMAVGRQTVEESLAGLAARVDTTGVGQAVLVWNPVAWERRELLEVKLPTAQQWRSASVTSADGRRTPAQVLDSTAKDGGFDTTVAFIADLPALGYEVLHLEPATPEAEDEERGVSPVEIEQLFTEAATRAALPFRWVAPDGAQMDADFRLQVLHEAPHGMSAWTIGSITGTETLTPEEFQVLSVGPVLSRFRVSYAYNRSRFDVLVTVLRSLGRVDFDMTADWQEVGNPAEGGPFLKAAFVTNIDRPTATFEIPWGSISRAPNGQEVPAQKWMDLAQTRRILSESGREARAIDVSEYFNEDVVAGPEQPADGDFDGGRRAYPEEIFVGAQDDQLIVEGVPFIVPPLAAGRNNAIRATGQILGWPAEACPALALLGASSNGHHGGTARLLYADGTEDPVNLSFSDWCFGPGPGEVRAASAGYRWVEGQRGEPAVNIWMTRLPADPTRLLRGIALPNEPNLHLFGLAFAEKATYEAQWGIALLNDCKYGFDVTGGTMRMSLLRASWDPDPTPDQGQHHMRFSLIPHEADWRAAQIPRRAMEFNNPPLARLVDSHPGPLDARQSYVRVEPPEMILAALKRAEDGNGIIARVYNSCGVGGTAKLICNLPFRAATACNLLEEPRGEDSLRLLANEVTLDLAGRIHATVRLEP